MKKLFLALIAFVAMTANAQNGVSNPYRFGQGEDSTRCIQNISIMNSNVKNNDYEVAYRSWKVLFDEFPVARVDTYTNGIKILNAFIKKEADPQKKEEYIDQLMAVYDQQIKYIDQLQEITKTPLSEGQIIGKKVIDLLKYRKDAPAEEVYDMLACSLFEISSSYATLFTHMHTHTFFFIFFSIMVCLRILNIVPPAIQ